MFQLEPMHLMCKLNSSHLATQKVRGKEKREILEGYVTRWTGCAFNWRLCVRTTRVVRKCVPTGTNAFHTGRICYKMCWVCFQLETVHTNNTSCKEMYLDRRSSVSVENSRKW